MKMRERHEESALLHLGLDPHYNIYAAKPGALPLGPTEPSALTAGVLGGGAAAQDLVDDRVRGVLGSGEAAHRAAHNG
ncbi:hypothetical protein ACIBG6_39195 [Streptomyces sp. NPDC050842]|uniref:hypothetical protein n=1 Tax=Streptomyces sp. NPDC050842 TaxID=3365636 RepID=UPI0037976694